jgi:hypothetical protein
LPEEFLTSLLETVHSCSEWCTLLRDILGFSTVISSILPCGRILPVLPSRVSSSSPDIARPSSPLEQHYGPFSTARPPTPPEQLGATSPFASSAGLSRYLASPAPSHSLRGGYVDAAPIQATPSSSKKRVRSDSDDDDQVFIEGRHLPFLLLPLLKHMLSCGCGK